MAIIIAPDSFKGTLGASKVSAIIKEEIHRIYPSVEIIEKPISDGGEGFVETIAPIDERQTLQVIGPRLQPTNATYSIQHDTVIIEMAEASGLLLVEEKERDPLHSTTYGVGQLIRYHLDKGYENFVLGLGGSATNDCGVGMLAALGVSFFDENGTELPIPFIDRIATMDDEKIHPSLRKATFTIASDVTNPLCGPQGATYVFGPQKGLQNEELARVDNYMKHIATLYEKTSGEDVREMAGAGAAGGLGAACFAFFNCTVISGISFILHDDIFTQHDNIQLVITGEGKSDRQTLNEKAPMKVAKLAASHHVPTILLSGSIESGSEEQLSTIFYELESVVSSTISVEESIAQPEKALRIAIRRLLEKLESRFLE